MATLSLSNTRPWECTPVALKTKSSVKSDVTKHADWTPGQWSEWDRGDSEEEGQRSGGEDVECLVSAYNEAMADLSEKTKVGNYSPLTFQLNTTWEEATEKEKKYALTNPWKDAELYARL